MIKKFFSKRWVKLILIIHGLILVSIVIMFFHMRNITIDEYEDALTETPYDVIIVPGVPFNGDTWQSIMKVRVHWSKYLYEQGYAKNIIYSGSAVYSPYVESTIMKLYGEALGLDSENLYDETKAEHSTENLHYSILMAKERGFKKIALATDPFQSYFLMSFASSNNLQVDFLPIQYNILGQLDLTTPKIDPSSAFVDNFVSLPERQGFIERFKGTLGKHIKTSTD